MKIRKILFLLLFTFALVACSRESDADLTQSAKDLGIKAENYPKIDGSTSTLKIVQAIYDNMFVKDSDTYKKNYPETASKTVPSYKKLIDGEVDLIITPYPSKEVLDLAKEKGVELEFKKLYGEALIFITSEENSAKNITKEQVRKIYLENGIKNWNEIGGPDKKLIPIVRNADSGSQSQLNNFILNNEKTHPDIEKNYVSLTMEGIVNQVAFYHQGGLENKDTKDTFALGYTLFTYLDDLDEARGIKKELKILNYEGIEANEENISNGKYPLTDGYYAVVRKDLAKDHSARKILEWLDSEQAGKMFNKLGIKYGGKKEKN